MLKELANNAPTFFFQQVQQFFDCIFNAVRDPKVKMFPLHTAHTELHCSSVGVVVLHFQNLALYAEFLLFTFKSLTVNFNHSLCIPPSAVLSSQTGPPFGIGGRDLDAHTDYELCCYTAIRSPSFLFKYIPPVQSM